MVDFVFSSEKIVPFCNECRKLQLSTVYDHHVNGGNWSERNRNLLFITENPKRNQNLKNKNIFIAHT